MTFCVRSEPSKENALVRVPARAAAVIPMLRLTPVTAFTVERQLADVFDDQDAVEHGINASAEDTVRSEDLKLRPTIVTTPPEVVTPFSEYAKLITGAALPRV